MKLELVKMEPSNNHQETPLLFVHGAWHTSWYWEENFLPYFAKNGYFCYALNLRGHGKSEGHKELRWTSLNDFVDDVGQAVEIIGKKPAIIGHSMGGAITQKYIEKNNMPAAVLIGSVPPSGIIPFTMRIILRYPLSFFKANLTLNMSHIVNKPKRAKKLFFSTNISDEIFNKCFSQLQNESYRVLHDLMYLNLPKPELVKTPVLVLGAQKDQCFTEKEIEATARAFHTQAEIFPKMAHHMMLESGWEEVADRIKDWLKEQGI